VSGQKELESIPKYVLYYVTIALTHPAHYLTLTISRRLVFMHMAMRSYGA
jgi:hypothetical protein